MTRDNIVQYLDQLLDVNIFQDYSPNGLQISGKPMVNTVVSGVTASYDLIQRAIALGADLLLVHHGYFWKGESSVITGIKHKRIQALINHDINLLAYHLPLDAHALYGNNAELAKHLGFYTEARFPAFGNPNLLNIGTMRDAKTPQEFGYFCETQLQQRVQWCPGGNKHIQKIAWCTGAAQDLIELAATHGVDAFISGEVSERTFHLAQELGVDYFACGHHATERYGIKALGEHLADHFHLKHHFVDVVNPI